MGAGVARRTAAVPGRRKDNWYCVVLLLMILAADVCIVYFQRSCVFREVVCLPFSKDSRDELEASWNPSTDHCQVCSDGSASCQRAKLDGKIRSKQRHDKLQERGA